MKRAAASGLLDAMQEVLKGECLYQPGDRVGAFLPRSCTLESATLTDRQRQVLRLVSEGRSAKEVAKSLSISVKTAQFHKTTIMQKLGIPPTAVLTKYAIDHGISSFPPPPPPRGGGGGGGGGGADGPLRSCSGPLIPRTSSDRYVA